MGPQVCTPGPSSLREDGALSLPLVREVGAAALSDAKLEAERPWGPERDRVGCFPSRPGSGPRTLHLSAWCRVQAAGRTGGMSAGARLGFVLREVDTLLTFAL